ncbi:MAG: hypothetical protein ABSD98_19560 [Candidatus Korobacteraceae bacterium]|jgi:hypothetical protein
MRRTVYLAVAAVLAGLTLGAQAQSADSQQTLQQKLDSQFVLTKMTADRNDIVTPGAVVVLHKDGLLMYTVAASNPPMNTYKGGKISHSPWATCPKILSAYCSSLPQQPANRTFVAGEQFWVTGFEIEPGAVIFSFYSDPYQDTRYYGQLKFPFKGQMPPADEALRTIAEVLTVQPSDNAVASSQSPPSSPSQPASTQAAAPETALPSIAPPPPPADAPPPPPKTISVGQTKEQVEAMFGPPQRVANVPPKIIYVYPDMKVTFVNGKVSAVD